VAYTDGLTEARNAKGEEYGEARLLRKVRELGPRAKTARAIRESLTLDIKMFMDEAEQMDDITIVAVKIKAPDEG